MTLRISAIRFSCPAGILVPPFHCSPVEGWIPDRRKKFLTQTRGALNEHTLWICAAISALVRTRLSGTGNLSEAINRTNAATSFVTARYLARKGRTASTGVPAFSLSAKVLF